MKQLSDAEEAGMHSYFHEVKKELGGSLDLSFGEFAELAFKKCYFCNAKGSRKITTKTNASYVERLDYKKKHTADNTVATCYHCQIIKHNLVFSRLKQTISVCRKLLRFQNGQK